MPTVLVRWVNRQVVSRSSRRWAAAILLAGVVGCGEQEQATVSMPVPGASESASTNSSDGLALGGSMGQDLARSAPAKPAAAAPAKNEEKPASPEIPRKIVYTAQVNLIVGNLADFGRKLNEMVVQAGGYVSKSDNTSTPGTRGTATWTVRIPVDKFDALFSAVDRMGELQRSHLDTQDVSQEYYDIEARITNKKQEEKRLLKHLEDSTGKLEDILAVEREISRVRGEIEQMQGRIRYLSNVSALSTLTITATEIVDYKPPVEPTFGTQIARTFQDSVGNLVAFGKGLTLFVVAIAPWIPVVLVIAAPIVWGVLRSRRPRPPRS